MENKSTKYPATIYNVYIWYTESAIHSNLNSQPTYNYSAKNTTSMGGMFKNSNIMAKSSKKHGKLL